MLNIPASTKIFICVEPVDMRLSFDGSAGMVQTHFGMSPLNGHLFVFFSRRRERMKIPERKLRGTTILINCEFWHQRTAKRITGQMSLLTSR